MDDILALILGTVLFVVYIVLLPIVLIIATPFILLIPGRYYCVECAMDECDCDAPKEQDKCIGARYGKIFSFWKRGFQIFG